jgi:hypothetical protein
MQFGESPSVRRDISPPCSESNSKLSKKLHFIATKKIIIYTLTTVR